MDEGRILVIYGEECQKLLVLISGNRNFHCKNLLNGFPKELRNR
jgi:hypothetical protein